MRKKDSILKRHPIIPSIFFLLFAWVLLYLITGFKDPEKSKKLFDHKAFPELRASGKQNEWDLEITKESIRFTQSNHSFVYPYVEPVVSTKSDAKFLKVYNTQNQNSRIQIFVLKKRETNIYDVIVEKDGEYYYTHCK
ncbi:MAG: hypothetical protein NW226_25235 [Microscillaceae bacterium]|nr:hypothetical protein [Microscillaceae bacterium]